MIEVWRHVSGFEEFYEVSSFGRVRSLPRRVPTVRNGRATEQRVSGGMLKPYIAKVGYPMVSLVRPGVLRRCYVHELVCSAFHGDRPKGCEVAHNDGAKTNNRADNLRWATRRENLKDKVTHGTQPRGDELWFTKVCDADVVRIRADRLKSPAQWARLLGVSESLIVAIRAGKRRVYAH